MPRHDYDKSSKWLVQTHGNALLALAGVSNVRQWKALQAEIVQPRQLPDGLLSAHVGTSRSPDHFLIEVATYPERRAVEQAMDDLMLSFQSLRVLPELLFVVLHPKGQLRIEDHHELHSRLGWSHLGGRWKVVELWRIEAENLLAGGDIGLVPLVPLM